MQPRSPTRIAALLVVSAALTGGRCGGGASDWKLAWSDEFDGPAGQAPDPATWSADVGTGWGNQQLEYDTARTDNAALDGEGHLAITARQESYSGSSYTSARLVTKGKVERRYGRVEARLKQPSGRGLWPAFWLLGANIDEVGWPACGEIDIMEYRGQEPTVAIGSLHGPGYSGGGAKTRSTTLPDGAPLDDDFHVYAIEWREGLITWELDGDVYHSVHVSDLPAGAAWVFDQPFFVILNVAVGGTFVGAPDGTTTFPQTMLVDYVRIYERE